MFTKLRRPRALWAAAVAGALLAVATPAATAPAVADPVVESAAVEASEPQILDIKASGEGIQIPTAARPGQVTFRVSTTDPKTGWVALVRPRAGVTFEQFRSSLLKIINHTSADIIEGSAELRERAELLGGTVIHPDLPASFTKNLAPGTYWFFDYQTIRNENPWHSVLTVGGEPSTAAAPTPSAVLTATMTDGQPVWDLQGSVTPGRPILYRNSFPEDQNAEAVFFRLAEDTTEEDLKAYINEFSDSGQFPDHSGALDLERGTGGLPMNAGETSLLQLTLEPGRYAVVDFFVDATDGTIFIKRGHWKIFEVK
ncbi:MAG: hypothetical protein LBV60_10785 [Streptomyces sp.]|jgi:hypothetical protein|nr:hypothetical protein [Streptomyces sp.]